MNSIYQVIWSKSKQCYVVVSEIAKRSGKGVSSKRGASLKAILCATALIGTLGMTMDSYAVNPAGTGNGVAWGTNSQAPDANSVALGTDANAAGAGSFVAGTGATSNAANGTAIGKGAFVADVSADGIAIGTNAKVTAGNKGKKTPNDPEVELESRTIAIGKDAWAKANGDVVIGSRAQSMESQYHGNEGSGAVVIGDIARTYGSRGDVVIGSNAEASIGYNFEPASTKPNNKYAQSIAIGSAAKGYGSQSLAIGADTRAIGGSTLAIGGDDIDIARPSLVAAISSLNKTDIQTNFYNETNALYPTLGNAALWTKTKYVNTAAIGHASTAIGMLSQSLGVGSTAIGINALTKGNASLGFGIMTRSWGVSSFALGNEVGAYGDRSASIGANNTVGFDMADGTKSGLVSTALGTNNKIYSNTSIALGEGNTIGQATVTTTTKPSGDGTATYNFTTVTDVKGNSSGALGNKNTVKLDNSYVMGNNSTTEAANAMVVGNNANVKAENGLALGNNTTVSNKDAVALGAGSETAAAVATPSAVIGGTTYNFAGINPQSTVSVGKSGAERTVTNVAAGRISDSSTDAINGSQLYAVTSTINKGVGYAGDVKAAAATQNAFKQNLGATTNVVGGVNDEAKLTDNNIGVVSNGTDTLTVKLAKDLNGLGTVNATTFKAGNTTINNNGLVINNGPSITSTGINAGGKKITNVQAGSDPLDAVNYSQLTSMVAAAGKATTVKAKDANVTVEEGTNAAGGKEYTVGVGPKVTLGTDATKQVVVDGTTGKITAGDKVTIDGTTGNINAGTVTITGAGTVNNLTNRTWNIDNPVIVNGQAATEDQLKVVSDGVKKNKTDITTINNTIAQGLNFGGDSGAVINKKLGQQLDIKGGATTDLTENNIGVISDGTVLNVKLKKDINLGPTGSVTTGNTTINNNGLVINNGPSVTSTGINAGGKKITNVQAGSDPLDAVNYSQLTSTVAAAAKPTTVKAKDANVTVEEGTNATGGKEYTVGVGPKVTLGTDATKQVVLDGTTGKITAGDKVTIDGTTGNINAGTVTITGAGTVNNLTNTTWTPGGPIVSGQAATEDQLKALEQSISSTVGGGLKFGANSGAVVTNNLGSTVNVKGAGVKDDSQYSGENIKTKVSQAADGTTTIDVMLAKDLNVDNVTVGKDGQDGKVGVAGKDGKDAVSISGKDGVGHIGLTGPAGPAGAAGSSADITVDKGIADLNGTEITRIKYVDENNVTHEVATHDDGMKYGGDNTDKVIKKKLNNQVNVIGGISDESKLTTEDNLGVISDGLDNLKVRLAKDLKGLNSVTTGDTVMNNNGITISNGNGAGNANGDKTVSLTKDGLNNGGNKITNVANGDVSANSTDAVNGSQLFNQTTEIVNKGFGIEAEDGNNVHKKLGENIAVVGDGKNISTSVVDGKVKIALSDDLSVNSVTTGDTKMDTNGLTINGGPSVTKIGIDAGGKKITNVAKGEALTDGVNLGQLRDEIAANKTVLVDGKNTTVEGDGTQDNPYKVNVNDNLQLGEAGANGKDGSIGVNGKDGSGVAINGKDGSIGMKGKDGKDALTMKSENGKNGVDGTDGNGGTDGMTRIVYEDKNNVKHEVATMDDGMKYGGDLGTGGDVTKKVITKKLNEQVNVVGGITEMDKVADVANIAVISDGTDNLTLRLAKDLTGLTSVTTGDTTMNTNGLTILNGPSITKEGINAGDIKITNVAPGTIGPDSKDAINGSQLWDTNQNVSKLGNQINRVGAGAAALAALHPLDFDPDDKWDFAVGYGNYKSADALALGAFYRPNESTMISVGGSIGGGENMINAGLSVKLGQGNHVSTSRVAMAKEIIDLRDDNKELRKQVEDMNNKLNSILGILDMSKKKDFPDTPENHWAYDYVATLAGNGIIEGYPDGMFGGDRSMTRYEFAAMFYRALKNGAPVDENMDRAMDEFESELRQIRLDRIRVDRISGDDNDRNKVERVRVNNKDNEEKNDYRDVYGSRIPKATTTAPVAK